MVAQVLNGETNMASLLKNVKKSKRAKVEARMLDVDTIIRRQSTQCVDQLKLTAGDSALFINGRLVGPLASNETLVSGDLHAVVTSDLDMGIARKVRRLVDEAEFTSLSPDDDTSDYRSALISHAATLVSGHLKKRGEISQYSPDLSKLDQLRDKLTGFDAGEELRAAGGYYHDVLAIVNPLSNDAQKFAPLLSYFADNCAIAVRVILNPNPRLSELPLKRFYRYVVPASEPVFGIDGAFRHGATAIFNNLPSAPLLTLGMDTPASWMIQATRSIHDLDNIHLDSAKRGVHAVFSLEYVVAWCGAVSRTGEDRVLSRHPVSPPFPGTFSSRAAASMPRQGVPWRAWSFRWERWAKGDRATRSSWPISATFSSEPARASGISVSDRAALTPFTRLTLWRGVSSTLPGPALSLRCETTWDAMYGCA